LQKSVVDIERMSMREVDGWVAWFEEGARAAAPVDDAIDPRTASATQLRGAFK
jgi:hypothetical protein